MNKLSIVLLAVCIVSAHAFVKRDAPANNPNYLENFNNIVHQAQEDIGKFLNPDNMKKTLSEVSDNVNKFLEEFKNKGTTNQPSQ